MQRRQEPMQAGERPVALPPDYLALVRQVFEDTFRDSLERLAPSGAPPRFLTGGGLYSSELVLWVSLVVPGQPAATTVHASADFDVATDLPTDAEERLAACVDALGTVFQTLLGEGAERKLRAGALAGVRLMPPSWQEVKAKGRRLHVQVDASHPELEAMTDAFLAKHGLDEAAEPLAESTPKPRVPKPPPTRH